MKRIDIVRKSLEKLGKDNGITASELADHLGITRANVSFDLNRLCEDGIAEKTGKKPVYYKINNQKEHIGKIDTFIYNNPSLQRSVELAKAGVLYPPSGMHMILHGETGVGKSMFAKIIFEYSLEKGVSNNPESFVAFNCADYANNSQLLVSQLFGVAKGAYTGADTDRSGLMEKADGGMLFLDEVHRLPPEGQEMLFSYMDNGYFRRLGDTQNVCSPKVQIICATTEDLSGTLLKTFLRRIPMQIEIPSLKGRTLEERFRLIKTFFSEESARLENSVMVTVNSMRALMLYDCPGNIGQLKGDIQILCAQAYAEFLSGQKESISITTFSLPQSIRQGILSEQNRSKVWSLFPHLSERFMVFESESSRESLNYSEKNSDIYSLIEMRTEEMKRIGLSQKEINAAIHHILADYYKSFSKKSDIVNVEHFVGSEITFTVSKMLALATNRLGYSFDENICSGLSIHIFNTIKRVRKGQGIINPNLEQIKKDTPEVFQVASECVQIVEKDFGINLPPDETGFIALFLAPEMLESKGNYTVHVIVAAHGNGVATGLAQTANSLLSTEIVKGFDVPLDIGSGQVYEQIRDYIKTSGSTEVMLLVDMGSLVNFSHSLRRELGISIRCFVMVSTLHVLEAARKAMMGYSLFDVYQDTKKVTKMAIEDAEIESDGFKLYLLTVCTTGEGVAKVIKDTLENSLDLKNGLCDIISLQLSDEQDFLAHVDKLQQTGKIIGVVSNFSTLVPVPHYDLTQILNGSGIESIQNKIDIETMFVTVSKTLVTMLSSIDVDSVVEDLRTTIGRIERALRKNLNNNMLIGVFCHMACMLDRLKRGEKAGEFTKKESLMKNHEREVKLISHECFELGKKYNVEIPMDEIYYLAAFFTEEDLF